MANKTITELSGVPLTNGHYTIVDNGSTTGKATVAEVLALASGISSSDSAMTCTGSNEIISVSGHYIPVSNSDFDIGSAEYKVRHLYLSANSIYMGNDPTSSGNKIGVVNDEIVFTKTDLQQVKPTMLVDPPVSSTSLGNQGNFAFDGAFFYVCDAENSWKRLALTAFEVF